MRAFMLTGVRRGEPRTAPEPPAPGPGEVRLRIARVGVCGSDLHYYRTGRIGDQIVQFPYIVGHECSGRVEAVGPNVENVAVGDRVAVDPSVSCGGCDQCQAGREHTCRNNLFLGCPGQLNGALSDILAMPAACCFRIPDSMSWEQAVISEPMAIAVYTTKGFVDFRGAAVGVLGCGPIGLSVLECAKAYGARSVVCTDPLEYRTEAARRLGADWAGPPGELEERLPEAAPAGLDIIVECCGMQEAVDQAFRTIRPGGTILMVGIPEFDGLVIPAHEARRREVRFQGVRRQVGCVPEALRLIGEGLVDADAMVTHHFPLERTAEAFALLDDYRDGVLKAMIEVTEDP